MSSSSRRTQSRFARITDLPGVSPAIGGLQWYSQYCAAWTMLFVGFVVIPALYLTGKINIETVNMLGRYLALAIVALSLDLVWGYAGMLCLCQSFFFSLGGYAMGMYLAHHGGPEGIIDANGWKLPACLYVVYPYKVGEAPLDALVPWFWKPFWTLPVTVILGLSIPGLVALLIGYFVFRSRVRGVFFAILTQAITLAAWLVFCMNNMKFCGTNGLTRFDRIAGPFQLSDPKVKLALYILTLIALVAAYWLGRRVVNSRLGRVLIAIRDNESRLRFSGYQPHHYKTLVFVLSAVIAGLGGMLYAPQMGIFTPTNLEVKESILVVIWVAVGGRGTLSGAILGAMAVNLLYNFLTSQREFFGFLDGIVSEQTYGMLTWKPDYWPFVLGGLFVGVVLLFPDGLISLWHRWTAMTFEPTSSDGPPLMKGGPERVVESEYAGPEGDEDTDTEAHRIDIHDRLSRLALLQRGQSESQWDGDLMRVENITVVFDGFKALDVESFGVPPCELRVIIGPNGAGKTTLCDVISGKTRVTTGRVFFAERDITTMPEVDIARLGVGRKFQTPTVFDSLTVYENMELSLPGCQGLSRNFWGRQTSEEQERILAILKRVRLIDQAKMLVKHLSHGQRQWLEMGMLLLAGPMLLLVDEPAAGLTDEETVLTAELLLEAASEHSIVVIEHDMEFVRLLNSHVTVLNEGKIMAQGSMEEVQADPRVVEAYLGR